MSEFRKLAKFSALAEHLYTLTASAASAAELDATRILIDDLSGVAVRSALTRRLQKRCGAVDGGHAWNLNCDHKICRRCGKIETPK